MLCESLEFRGLKVGVCGLGVQAGVRESFTIRYQVDCVPSSRCDWRTICPAPPWAGRIHFLVACSTEELWLFSGSVRSHPQAMEVAKAMRLLPCGLCNVVLTLSGLQEASASMTEP